MPENLRIVSDLAIILISAGVVTVLFKLLKQPLVLGYIVVGFLVGPHMKLFPTVTDIANIEVWSEIGIIFLLFGLGLEFSFKKLFSVGSKAFLSATIEIMGMMGVGILLGFVMGWGIMESVFLGGMLAMSSTTIIIKAFDDLRLKNEPFVGLTMVILIIQDIVAIVMMVLLSTAAASKQFAGVDMFYSIVKLVFFLVLWFVVGIYILPTLFRKAKRYVNDETLLILSIGLCFGMVIVANNVGFSSALGAFVMGSILSETIESENIIRVSKGLKDLFGAIFFVSVGMMVNPQILAQYWKLILSLIVITLVVKTTVSVLAVLVSGGTLEESVRTGYSLSQIGEFAFIIASIAVSSKLMPAYIYPVVIAASVITTFTTPYWIKMAAPACRFLGRHLSAGTRQRLDDYCLFSKKGTPHDWNKIIKASLTRVIVFTVLSFALLTFLFDYVFPLIEGLKIHSLLPRWLFNTFGALAALALVSPFLYGIVSDSRKTRQLYRELTQKSKGNIFVITVWTILRMVLAGFFVFSVLVKFYKYTKWVIVLVACAIVIFMMFSRRALKRLNMLETNFMANLNK